MDPRKDPAPLDDWPALTEADRRAIAEIRRELDREYGAVEYEAVPAATPRSSHRAVPASRAPIVIGVLIVAAWGGVVALALSLTLG